MLEFVTYFNFLLALTISAAYFYQLVYLMYGIISLKKPWIFIAGQEHRYAVMISARNEEEVIGDCIDSCLKVDYPAEKKHVVVFCHNCSDRTAQIAREHGARAIEIFDDHPDHQKASYCMYHGMNELKKDGEGAYEYFLFIDADNQVDRNYLRACNDAVDDGVELVGYTPWSAMDLVSVSTGEVEKRYGFVYVDKDNQGNGTMKRYKKDSFYWYKHVIETNGEEL